MYHLALVSFLVAFLEQGGGSGPVTFAKDSVGKVPPTWKEESTGKGKGSIWRVVADVTAPSGKGFVLAQTTQSPDSLFNLCVYQDAKARDVNIQVHFKAHKGEVDQGGGLVWRYQDANNYYVARMNPLESNFRLYKVVDGKRIQLDSAKDIKIAQGTWHTIKVRQVGTQITCYVDDKKYLEAKDETIAAAGKIGLWTKADAETYFDQLRWSSLDKKQADFRRIR
jgi:Domain of Unknown Function (DUF1080)